MMNRQKPEIYQPEDDGKQLPDRVIVSGKKSKGVIREQVDNVGESGKNIVVFFFKEFHSLIIYFINDFKSRRKNKKASF
jgi:hypothetical protein